MVDTIIKGTGNSRSIKAAPDSLPATYDEFRTRFISSGISIDIGPLNPTGLVQKGNDLNKATLLTDATEIAIWGDAANRTPDQALHGLLSLVTTAQSTANGRAMCEVVSYTGTGTSGPSNPTSIQFSFPPKLIICTYSDFGGFYTNAVGHYIWLTSVWNTSPTANTYFGFPNTSWGYRGYGYKSPDGRTFSWYIEADIHGTWEPGNPNGQNNTSGEVYRYIGIG